MNILPKISVPTYRMNVPSTGQEIEYRPYMVKEEKVLLIALSSEDNNQIYDAILNIIKECCPQIKNINNLITSDIEYVFLKLRCVSVGAKVEIIKICEHCDEHNDVNINLNNIFVENEKTTSDLRVEVEQKFVIDMHYPTIINEEDESALIKTVASCIKTVYYGEETYSFEGIPAEEQEEFISNLTSKQFSKLVVVLLDAPFVSYKSDYKCKACGKENEIYFTGLIDFFI